MTCDRCEAEAAFHHADVIDGRRREMHLCLRCAKQAGMVLPNEPPLLPLDAVVQNLIVSHVGELVGELARATCPECGQTYMGFRGQGRLGCPGDYQAFAKGLSNLIGRFHGATRHVGKRPKRSTLDCDRDRIRLRNRLRDAVAREDYETAAGLRDLLRPKDAD
ncbi:MAG: UvrB/UvrC motif-containing protein [Isosphaeraceae bacterium]|nr:UvrB/UvrC motif-containing protein [Isosphaeraceae bacterium]